MDIDINKVISELRDIRVELQNMQQVEKELKLKLVTYMKERKVRNIAGEGISVTMAKRRGYKVVEKSVVPEEFWKRTLDAQKVGRIIVAIGSIPGIEETESEYLAIRTEK